MHLFVAFLTQNKENKKRKPERQGQVSRLHAGMCVCARSDHAELCKALRLFVRALSLQDFEICGFPTGAREDGRVVGAGIAGGWGEGWVGGAAGTRVLGATEYHQESFARKSVTLKGAHLGDQAHKYYSGCNRNATSGQVHFSVN